MREIKLTQGHVTLVDDEDYEWLSRWEWGARQTSHTIYAHRYVLSETSKTGFTSLGMHRLIMDINDPKLHVDHENGNGLDNQRTNLRVATPRQNAWNQQVSRKSISGYKGVSWHPQTAQWRARIKVDGKSMHLGLFDDAIEAAHAYDQAALRHFGEFARLNAR